jgi:hypothetical protein
LALLAKLHDAYNSTDEPDYWAFRVEKGVKEGPLTFAHSWDEVIISNEKLKNHQGNKEDWIFTLASSFLMDLTETFEQKQGQWFSWVAGKVIGNSSFSDEDLVSNLTGFYQAKIAVESQGSGTNVDWDPIERRVVERLCMAFHNDNTVEEIYDLYWPNGTSRIWEPKLISLGCRIDDREVEACAESRAGQTNSFPYQLRQIVDNRIKPSSERFGHLDTWWWNTDWLLYGDWQIYPSISEYNPPIIQFVDARPSS